ncbi:MAG TPA: DHA2 family efflux MFS transporter permease subunit [Ktedonobacterales bacterium]|nr:DHA2 family efflux MFS transporter permease subunit [Ktedonobacterales bacterium]
MRLDYKWQAAIVSTLGLFMAVLDNTIVSVALPQMQTAFHTDFDTITWVVSGYFLAQAAVIPITGYLSDRVGTKLVFLVALALFTVGSGLCALAPTQAWLIVFRILQGIGGGALFPMAFAIVFRVFPPTERGPASAIISVPVLLAPAFGPTIGGFLTTTFDWRAIFTVNLPVGVVAFTLGAIVLRGRAAELATGDVPTPEKKRFDIAGLFLAMVGFSALVYGITEASSKGWGDPLVLGFIIGGGVVLVAFIVTELLVSDPVVDLRLFANYTFTISNVLMWAVAAFLFGSLFLLPEFFEILQGLTPLSAGEILIAQGLSAAVATAIGGSLYNRVGPRILATVGLALLCIGTIGFTQLDINTTGAQLQPWLIVRGLGLGFANLPLQTLALSVVSNRAMARASSLVNVARQVFAAVGVAILTTYLTQQVNNQVNPATAAFKGQPSQQAALAAQKAFSGAPLQHAQAACAAQLGQTNTAGIASCVQHAGQQFVQNYVTNAAHQYIGHAAAQGFNSTFLLVVIVCGVAAVLALFVGRDPAIEAARRAKERGETVETPRVPVASE